MGIFTNLMKELEPDMILKKTHHEHDHIRGRYVVKSPIVRSYNEFCQEVIKYYQFHFSAVFGIPPYDDLALAKAREFLEKGFKGGWENAVMCGLSGDSGGMRYICDSICEGFMHESEQAYIAYILDTHLDPLDFRQLMELMREFKATLLNYAPASFQAMPVAVLAADYRGIIRQYIESLRRYSNLRKW